MKPKFKVGDKVQVPHTDKHYQAKVLKSDLQPDGHRYYLLHYLGWNKKWDEWVTEDELQSVPTVKISLKKRAPAGDAGKSNKQAKKHHHHPHQQQLKEETPEKTDAAKGTKKRKANEVDRDTHLQLHVELPAILKKQLLDEHDLVTTEHKTVVLPRKPNASQILRQFYDYGKKELRSTNTELQMLVTGLEEYMDKTLEDFLLYEIEWPAAKKLLSGGIRAASVYGAEHLLRLLVKLPDLIPPTSVSPQQAAALNVRLADFLDFLVVNRHDFFANVKEYCMCSETPSVV